MKRPKKGTRLVYTGSYAPTCTARYGVGEVVGFRTARQWPQGSSTNKLVTVRLVDDSLAAGEDRFADWPLDEIMEVP